MANVLAYSGDESVTIPGPAARALLDKGHGDAALLYIALLRHHGTVPPRALAGELRWERRRLESAEQVLRELKLLAAETAPPPEPADERPSYQRDEVADHLEQDEAFRSLTGEVEKRLGKRLTTADIAILLGLNDYLGLPADVIYLLVCHCAERIERKYGPGRRPGMKQIEKEGYAWSRMGIDTQAEAAEYLRKYAEKQKMIPRYMQALQLGDRAPSPSEEKYLLGWQEMGFSPEAVSLAADRTIFKCHELKWAYCNGILRRWDQDGLHTAEEIQAAERPAGRKNPAAAGAPEREDVAWMKKYIQQRDKGV